MKKRKRLIPMVALLILLPCLPFILTFCTYVYRLWMQEGSLRLSQLLDALYDSLKIYSMSVSSYGSVASSSLDTWGTSGRLLLEIARWGAMIVVASAALKLLSKSLQRLGVSLLAMHPNYFALHGDAAPLVQLKKDMKMRAIKSDIPEKYNLSNHILAFRRADDLYKYLDSHFAKMTRRENSRLFIYTDAQIHSVRSNPQIIVNNIAKNCARLYWKKYWLRPEEKRIVMIGNGHYISQLITQALQVNVFTARRELEYHIFDCGSEYCARHPQLDKVAAINKTESGRDSVFFHSESWLKHQPLISSADRVIICYDEEDDSLPIMDYMLEKRIADKIFIRLHNADMVHALWSYCDDDHCSIVPFGTDSELYSIDQITNASLNSRGMLIHAYYSHRYCEASGKRKECSEKFANCTACPKLIAEWQNLNAYKKSSCIAQDDHSDVKIRELLGFDIEDVSNLASDAYAAFMKLTDEEKTPYIKLEHDRWMRFLYLHGWSYNPVRDDNKLRHHLLIPFDELPEDEKCKDADAYMVLSELDTYREFRRQLIRRL